MKIRNTLARNNTGNRKRQQPFADLTVGTGMMRLGRFQAPTEARFELRFT